MNDIDALHHKAAKDKINQGIRQRGYQCVTFISDEHGERHPYHYTVGLSEMGYAEIFISGRIPTEVAYAFIEKMVARWKEEKGLLLGKFGIFKRMVEKVAYKMVSRKATIIGHFPAVAKQTNGAAIPMSLIWVTTDEQREKDPYFMQYLYEQYPDKQNIPVVQLIWPDDHGQLPDSPHYTGNEEYKQEMLPTKN